MSEENKITPEMAVADALANVGEANKKRDSLRERLPLLKREFAYWAILDLVYNIGERYSRIWTNVDITFRNLDPHLVEHSHFKDLIPEVQEIARTLVSEERDISVAPRFVKEALLLSIKSLQAQMPLQALHRYEIQRRKYPEYGGIPKARSARSGQRSRL